jgi:hypothetical protein
MNQGFIKTRQNGQDPYVSRLQSPAYGTGKPVHTQKRPSFSTAVPFDVRVQALKAMSEWGRRGPICGGSHINRTEPLTTGIYVNRETSKQPAFYT